MQAVLLTEADFRMEILVPGTERPEVCRELTRFIEQYEPAFMDAALGTDFAAAFYAQAAASTRDAQWTLLATGGSWTDSCSAYTITRRIQGLTWCAARYVYFWWARNNISLTSLSGEVMPSTDNSVGVTPAWKQTQAWNSLCREMQQLWAFLKRYQVNGSAAFPTFLLSRPTYHVFRVTSPLF